jgi:N-acetylglucosamine-6-phosphate deacetylase
MTTPTPETLRLRGLDYRTGRRIEVIRRSGVIVSVEPGDPDDPENLWIAPALFDLQINGCLGKAFVAEDLTLDDVRLIVSTCREHGIAALCPTLITASSQALTRGFALLAKACEEDASLNQAMPCFHLEGPWISPVDGPRGAHPAQHVTPPDREAFRRWQDAAGGRIRLVTLSPEYESSPEIISWLSEQGVVVAIGHTAATASQIRAAVKAGAKLSTHLGNGSHAMLPRHDNYLWEQMACDELLASLITDGHHLPEAVMRSLIRVKTTERVIVTCDASSLAGLSPGSYSMWGKTLEVQANGRVGVAGTPFLAGSGMFTDDCLRVLLRLGEVSLTEAVQMASLRPRRLLGLDAGDIEVGSRGPLMLFAHEPGREFEVRMVV